MKFFILFLILFSQLLWATPKKTEVWFLSPPKTAMLHESLERMLGMPQSKALAVSDDILKDCTPMGDGCFHPQVGYINQKPIAPTDNPAMAPNIGPTPVPKKVDPRRNETSPKLKTFNAIETDLINCDKDYYFDIYCGQAKKEVAIKGKMEIWVDISSSFKAVDYSKDNSYCQRRSFVSRVLDGCPNGYIDVSVYDTSKKELGDRSTLCLSYGMNNAKRMMEWIQSSEANYLLIITDIDELTTEFDDFLTSVGAKYRGVGVTPMYANEMDGIANEIILQCRNKK